MEAVAAVPMFFCAICTLLMIGQMLITQTQIKYTVSKTAGMYACHEPGLKNNQIIDNLEVNKDFYSFLDENQLCKNCIVGGKTGIVVFGKKEENYVSVTAVYLLRVPIPYFKSISFPIKCTIQKRIFSGYLEHEGESTQEDPIVYVAKYGKVYHTEMTCSHICIKINDRSSIENIMAISSYEPCKKCIKPGNKYTTLYLTVNGDAYHSTLRCSGLKRTIRAIRLSEVGGMRPCSRCVTP